MNKNFIKTVVVGLMLAAGMGYAQSSQDPLAPQGTPGGITDSSVHQRSNGFVIMAELPYGFYGLGIGIEAKYKITLLQDGFLPGVNDSFELEPALSADYGFGYFGYSSFQLAPHCDATWTFHFSPQFSAFAFLGLGVGFWIGVGGDPYYYDYPGYVYSSFFPYFWVDGGVGIKYKFGQNVALRAEVGRALRVGFEF